MVITGIFYKRLDLKEKLIKEIDRVNREVEHISEVELLNKNGFPEKLGRKILPDTILN